MAFTKEEIDSFVFGYKRAIIFTDADHSVTVGQFNDDPDIEFSEGSFPHDVTIDDFSEDSLLAIHNECEDFINSNQDLIREAVSRPGYSFESAGHDFWLTRNGHGAGFWDRYELSADDLGDKLSKACRHTDRYTSFGVDNKIYCEG